MAQAGFSWGGFVVRLLAALLLVFATYNPEGISFFHWIFPPTPGETGVASHLHGFTPLKAMAGLGLVAGWVVFLQATRRSLGLGGSLLVLGIFGCTIWAMIYYGLLTPGSSKAIANLVLTALGLVLGVGMSWSLLTSRMSGQVDTDEVG